MILFLHEIHNYARLINTVVLLMITTNSYLTFMCLPYHTQQTTLKVSISLPTVNLSIQHSHFTAGAAVVYKAVE